MQREHIVIDQEKGIARLTLQDERWYIKEVEGVESFIPSCTWICGFYPKGVAFYKWLANKGWDEAEAIKSSAGDKGSKVHKAIEDLLLGKEVKIEAKYLNNSSGLEEDLTAEEYEGILSFSKWFNAIKPKILRTETFTFNDRHQYAGTVDLICEIEGVVYVVDFKTSQNVWTEYELQLSAYKHALISEGRINDAKLAILQVGYKRNKNGYKFTEIDDKFDLFLSAKAIWKEEAGKQQPLQKDLPLSISLNLN